MAKKEFTGRHLLLILASFFGVMLAVNVVFVYLAVSTFQGVQRPDAYQEGLDYNDRIAEARKQAALLWSHRLSVNAEGRIELTVTDARGEPVSGLTVSGHIERPVLAGSAHDLTLGEAKAGLYAASGGHLDPGNWVLSLTATKAYPGGAEAVYRIKERLWLKPKL